MHISMFSDILEQLNSGKKLQLTVNCTHKLFLVTNTTYTLSTTNQNMLTNDYGRVLDKKTNLIGFGLPYFLIVQLFLHKVHPEATSIKWFPDHCIGTMTMSCF